MLKFLEVVIINDNLIPLTSSDIWEHATKQNTASMRSKPSGKKKAPPTQLTVSETFKRQEPYSRDSKRWMDITKLMEFIGLDEHPLCLVEDMGFQRLTSFLEPRYAPPLGRSLNLHFQLPGKNTYLILTD